MDNCSDQKPFSLKEFVWSAVTDKGNLAFTATVAAAFLSVFLAPEWQVVSPQSVLLIVLGLLFWLAGTFAFDYIEFARSRLYTAGYFAVMLLLAFVIMVVSHSESFVVILNLPIVAHAVTRLKFWGAVAVCVAALISFGIALGLYVEPVIALQAAVASASGVVFVAIFTRLAINEQHARKEVERLAAELTTANQKLREYAAQIEELATARERNRIAREIHDGLGHYLTVINMQIQAARAVQESDPTRANEAMGKAGAMAQEALADVRRSVAALRSSPTDNKPLAESIQSLAEETRASGIQTEFVVHGTPRPLSPQADLTLYRATQEALTNTRKHAHASAVNIALDYEPDCVKLSVKDNGVGGIEPNGGSESPEGGFGLLGVRERTQLLNGEVKLSTATGQGFLLEVTLPC